MEDMSKEPSFVLKRSDRFGHSLRRIMTLPKNSKGFIYFDDSRHLKDNYLNFKVKSVKITTASFDNYKIVTGIQFYYKDLNKSKGEEEEILTLPDHRGKLNIEREENYIELKEDQYLSNFHMRQRETTKGNVITSLGFSLNTGEKKIFGSEIGEEISLGLEDEDLYIFATYGYYESRLESLGVYYINRKEFKIPLN
ncbi:MAG: hypothetical protein MJ252_25415 [archaeon]|nr:hypothetical protein [archaeon]